MEDNYSKWEQHQQELDAALEKRPKCDYCNEPIQDDYFFEINGEFICEDCLDRFFKKCTDDFVTQLT